MIPSAHDHADDLETVYQRGLVIDSQRPVVRPQVGDSISKGIGD